MKNSRILGVIVAMQAIVLLGQWFGPVSYVTTARAESQISNPAERQVAMVEELRALNAKMERLLSLLQNGEVQIKVAKPDDGNKPEADNK